MGRPAESELAYRDYVECVAKCIQDPITFSISLRIFIDDHSISQLYRSPMSKITLDPFGVVRFVQNLIPFAFS